MKSSLFFLFMICCLTSNFSFAENGGCTAAKPIPLLDKAMFKEYSFKQLEQNKSLERVGLAQRNELVIETSGCADVSSRTFTFTLKNERRSLKDLEYWVNRAKDEFFKLKFLDEKRFNSKLYFEIFFNILKTYKLGKKGNTIDISFCLDGKEAVSECLFDQAGRSNLKVINSGDHTVLTLSRYDWL